MISRRVFCVSGIAAAIGFPSAALAFTDFTGPSDALLRRASAALQRHRASVANRDTIGIVDFAAPSHAPRFHIFSAASGRSQSLLVAHGRGSDPDHSGWLERFSNAPGSQASSSGAYLCGETYQGKHGLSRRLVGLDATNNNAEARAIVIHHASYVSSDIARNTGKVGRSEGCLAVAQEDLEYVLSRLRIGQLIYVDKI